MDKERRWLVVFIKEPKAGRVKTRLGAGLGVVRATMLYRYMIARIVRKLSGTRRWQMVAAMTPGRELERFPALKGFNVTVGQGDGDLGERMARVFAEMPPGPVVIIGTDIPDIDAGDITRAFGALRRADVVVGPAGDGGYWLIGLAAGARRMDLFQQVRWSTRHTLADTLANLPGNCRIARLRVLTDLDRREDFIRWTQTGGRTSR